MSLIAQLQPQLQLLPETLRATIASSLHALANTELPRDISDSLVKVWASSEFIATSCTRHAELLPTLIESGNLTRSYSSDYYTTQLKQLAVTDEAELMKALRDFRRREMVRIAWRDLAGWSELSETLTELSWLADACIQTALDFLYSQACEKRGTPLLADGTPQQIIILGMGKLGAFELNYSSDIDLIFAYPEDGVLNDRKATSYGEFFTKLCQSLVRVLDDITVDGFVFRTDIRLRPYGDSGAVIMTFDGMEHYYLTQAREWERYAMIKARQVAGDFVQGKHLMSMLSAFVYRRYLDYGAFEELRSLKAQITQELRRKDRLDNVKLGAGGIREVEFIGQAFQLIRGGTEKRLQTRGIMDVLQLLGELDLMSIEDANTLRQAYCFLRRVENHIQQYQDKQTHDLPTTEIVQTILAYSLDYADWHSFKTELDAVRGKVHALFDQVFSVSKQEQVNPLGHKIWANIADKQELLEDLGDYSFRHPQATLTALQQFKNAPSIRRLSSKGAGVLNRLIPQLIAMLQKISNPDETLNRLLDLFAAVAGRTVYLSLLEENPLALDQLIKLSSASAWICDYLARHPILFDELLDPRSLYEPLKKSDLTAQLVTLLAPIETQDLEQLMIALRQFKQQQVLRVAAADIMGVIPLMVVSDYLTTIAESIVEQVLNRAWLMLVDKHGYPPECQNKPQGFGILGFGKLGGIELGYGSDLDMVFLYDCPDGNALTDGDKPISAAQFYGRLGLKVRHILDTKLLSGVLYEVDMRLRPSGDSGLLVTPISSYEDYLTTQAWTWEHQALVRARFITGDEHLKNQYEAIRHRVLSLPRDKEKLKIEVREMREKMRSVLDTKETDKFDLKQSKGGIADIEFMVQFGILAEAADHPTLTTYTDNVRLLEGLAAHNIISQHTADTLKAAYCAYRDIGHKQVLQGDTVVIDEDEVAELHTQVEQIWQVIM
ncbi:bifunctional glutamine synthetase adenylyltransferase/deadenyltransferase [Crenothrix sp. D3]|nr:bifunctional glutamine synthetase adenylyltransferase/deadenyltransferase [Crenothrix sp. D3]